MLFNEIRDNKMKNDLLDNKGEVITIDGIYCEGTDELFKFKIWK